MHEAIARIQAALAATHLDGWLIYDFQGLNPFARTLLGIPDGAHLTRRYFVFVPREGRASVMHHRIEGGTWGQLSGGALDVIPYSGHGELDVGLARMLAGAAQVAMEYSPRGAVPYVSRVDAGTLERVREAGVDVASSADLLQGFLAWSEEDLAAHLRAVDVLMRAKDAAFQLMHERLRAGEPVTELEVQAVIEGEIERAGMTSGHPANVSFGAHAADPHYEPTEERAATLQVGQCVLIDLWCQEPGRPFADVTWMGFAGPCSPAFSRAWEVVSSARDSAIALLKNQWRDAEGWMLDRAARGVIEASGLGEHFTHRLGHSLGVQIHGAGANLDDLETHDTRKLLPGLAVTIEPGVYPLADGYGVRSEVNVYLDPRGPRVTTPVQRAPFVMGEGEWEAVRAAALPEELVG